MNLDGLPLVLSYSGGLNGPGRRPRSSGSIDLLVVHTNDGGPQEPISGAEGLASYTARYLPPDCPAYHVVCDSDSAIRTARDNERVNGAGGVAETALHLCLYGTAAQTVDEWHDSYSRAELVIAADLTRQLCDRHQIPKVRVDPLPGARGICGHVDVSRHYPASQGHTDPGAGFPWNEFLAMVRNATSGPLVPDQEEDSVYVPYNDQTHRFFKNTDTGEVGHAWDTGFENMTAAYGFEAMAPGPGPIAVYLTPNKTICVSGLAAGQRFLEYRFHGGWVSESWPK